jgi:hypothetical protein
MKRNQERPIYVLDTATLMESPWFLQWLHGKIVCVPETVHRRLFSLSKNKSSTIRKQANRALTMLYNISVAGDISKGVALASGNIVQISNSHVFLNVVQNISDNIIIGTALKLHQANPSEKVVLLTQNKDMMQAARGMGLISYAVPDADEIGKMYSFRSVMHYMPAMVLASLLYGHVFWMVPMMAAYLVFVGLHDSFDAYWMLSVAMGFFELFVAAGAMDACWEAMKLYILDGNAKMSFWKQFKMFLRETCPFTAKMVVHRSMAFRSPYYDYNMMYPNDGLQPMYIERY